MTRRAIKRLVILLLFAFSWQSVAAPILDCCDEPMQEHDAVGMSAHSQMQEMNAFISVSEGHELMNHAAHPDGGAGADCNCDCICEYCVVSTLAMLENSMQQFTVLTGPLNTRFNFGPSFSLPENPFRPPIFA